MKKNIKTIELSETESFIVSIINIGDFKVNENVYQDRCLSASFGGTGVTVTEVPWENTENNPWDYRAEYEMVDDEKRYTGIFILDKINIPEPEYMPTEQEKARADIDYLLMLMEE